MRRMTWDGLTPSGSGLHVKSCSVCATEIEAFEHVGRALRSDVDELPAGLNWDRLAAEMTANIHLGLEAGECVGPAPVRTRRIEWAGEPRW